MNLKVLSGLKAGRAGPAPLARLASTLSVSPGSGSPHLLRRGDKGRSGTVLSGLLDPSKTRAGYISLMQIDESKKGTAWAMPFE
jgi:hypothetical protein